MSLNLSTTGYPAIEQLIPRPLSTGQRHSYPPNMLVQPAHPYHDTLGMLRFVTADASTLGQKRKPSQRACQQCRKRKKRCNHVETLQPSTAFRQPSPKPHALTGPSATAHGTQTFTAERDAYHRGPENFDEPVSNRAQSASSPFEVSSITASNFSGRDVPLVTGQASVSGQSETRSAFRDPEPLGSRFIGDLNPEGVFHAATSSTSNIAPTGQASTGIWLVDKLSSRAQNNSGSLAEQAESNCFYGYSPLVQKVLLPLLIEECLSVVPPQSELQALCNIYFRKNHPIFPVVDKAAFGSMDPTQPASILLKQGICLVASLNVDARSYLRLQDTSSTLSHREFGKRLSAAMRTSVDIGLVTEKIVLIQA
jgi:hypothetical protein